MLKHMVLISCTIPVYRDVAGKYDRRKTSWRSRTSVNDRNQKNRKAD